MSVNKHLLNSNWVQTLVISWERCSNDCVQSGAPWITILIGHSIIIHFFLNTFPKTATRNVESMVFKMRWMMPGLYCIKRWSQDHIWSISIWYCPLYSNREHCSTIAKLINVSTQCETEGNLYFSRSGYPKDFPNPPKIFPSGGLGARGEATVLISADHHLVSIL